MRWTARTRIGLAAIALACVFSGFSARLVYLQVGKHEEFAALAAKKNSFRQSIHAFRGQIRDARGEILAADRPTRTVYADGSHVTDPAALGELAATFLEMDPTELAGTLDTERKYVVLKRGVPEETFMALHREMQERGLRGIYSENTAERIYPNGPLLGHVLGFLSHEAVGVQGIERTMNEFLQGEHGFRHVVRDRTGKEIVVYRGIEHPARNGHNVELTIDMSLQALLEEELDNAYRELNPRSISAVLVRPSTGEILAMACRPNFDPNEPGKIANEGDKNRVIIDQVEPGSTFKIVAIAAALNENVVETETPIFCENGAFFHAGRRLRDAKGYGTLSVHDVLVKSSNIGTAKIAMKLGNQTFYEYIRKFGFGERSGIDLPGEIPGLVHPPHRWTGLSITRIPMGHEIAVTPLQITMATAAIANGGKLMLPQIVRRIVDEDGNEIHKFQPQVVREVVRPEVAAKVSAALADVVGPRGTARLAAVQGFQVGGKTGTAQRVDPNGGYTPGKYVVSFCGYMPVEKPEFAGLVIVDDASTLKTSNYGGMVAAPIFSRIAERAARSLDLEPSLPPEILTAVAVPAATGGQR